MMENKQAHIGPCPGEAMLETIATTGSDDAALLVHISSCDVCRSRVEEIKSNNDFLKDFDNELRPSRELFEEPIIPVDLMPGYRILGEIHRGAQGIVYKAEQERTKRLVAIKMLLQGAFATPRQRARFEREAEIAAQLRHPSIVTVYDSMAVRGGRFALVMEHIDGQPLDDWRDAFMRGINHTSRTKEGESRVRTLVAMFTQICSAVHYAHQRGVIHRDLKPANILVDRDGLPHVLDFGIAKIAGPSGDGAPPAQLVTQPGEFAGTLAYASPEQISGKPDLIDTRTDVYTLGVILYELLTGSMPYGVYGTFAEVIDNILNETPKPPQQLTSLIDHDLSTIVLRALHKEKDRRYQSAGALLADLEHYLRGEAIDAKRDSAFYVLRKSIVKRKAVAIAAASLLGMIVVGVSMSAYALAEATQREVVEEAKALEEKARIQAQKSEQQARTESQTAQSSRDFLNEMLTSVAPGAARGKGVSVNYVLEQAANQLASGRFANQPKVEAQLLTTLGTSYFELGDAPKAITHLERAIGLLRMVSIAQRDKDKTPPVQPTIDRADNYEDEANESLASAAARITLGRALALMDQYGPAEKNLDLALRVSRSLAGEASPEAAACLNAIGWMRIRTGDFSGAERILRQGLAIRNSKLAPDDPNTVETTTLLASALWQGPQQDFEGAEKLLRNSLAFQKQNVDEEHPYIANCLYELSHLLLRTMRFDEAKPLVTQCLQIRTKIFGPDHRDTLHALDLLAGLEATSGSPRTAETYLLQVIEGYTRIYGPSDALTYRAQGNLGKVYYRLGNYEKSEPLILAWYEGLISAKPREPEVIDLARLCMVRLYEDWGREEQAEEWRGK